MLLAAVLLLTSCASPTARIREFATRADFTGEEIRADGFDHLVYHNGIADRASILHVYLEGDGQPWRHRTVVMPDPTPRYPLMLQLMRQDPMPAVYVGRPCYYGNYAEPGCDARLWTSARYSPEVVDSMSGVVRSLARRYGAKDLWLFGHSGGGALAMLIAARISSVSRVVTLAGNLNVAAWTRHHRYTPLYSSLDPAREPPLRDEVRQWHLVGQRDSVVPTRLVVPFIREQSNAVGIAFPRFDHGCCWSTLWRDVLLSVERDEPERLPGVRFR